MTPPLILLTATLLISLVSVGLLRRFFLGQVMDIPNERSSHTRPTPRGGGLGFIIAFAIALTIALQVLPALTSGIQPRLWFLLIPLALIGVLDDWRNVPSTLRYLIQFSVALIVVFITEPFSFPGLEGLGGAGEWIAFAITVICFTALINFYNFMDGLDGLVAGVSAAQLSFLALWCHQPVLWLWVAALVGFLVWNWDPAKIFMGDAGSTVLGAIVAISLLSQSNGFEQSWISIAILFPLIGDAIYTLARRFSKGENIFQAHRTHVYQRLHQVGWPHHSIAGIYIGMTLLIAVGLWRFGSAAAWMSLVATIAALLAGELYLMQGNRPSLYKPAYLVNHPANHPANED